jgi:hypothetical protein
MTLIVEDGSGMSNADALISVAFADTYHADRGNSAWTGDATVKEPAIRRATSYISTAYTWQGWKRMGRPQSLAWPRTGVIDREGWGVAFDSVPIEIQRATAEVALRELVTPGIMDPDYYAADQVKSRKAGDTQEVYVLSGITAQSSRPILLIVRDLIAPLVKIGSDNCLVGSAYRV